MLKCLRAAEVHFAAGRVRLNIADLEEVGLTISWMVSDSSFSVDGMGLNELDKNIWTRSSATRSRRPGALNPCRHAERRIGTIQEIVEPYLLKIGYISRTAPAAK